MNDYICIRCYVSGRVQGVWYRATAKEQADKLGITGFARNMPDGRVEILACGSKDKLDSLYAWMHKGPPLAEVTRLTRVEEPWEKIEGFRTY